MHGAVSFPEGAGGISAGPALHAEASVTQRGDFPPAYALSGQDPRQQDVEQGDPGIHAAGRDSQDGNGIVRRPVPIGLP